MTDSYPQHHIYLLKPICISKLTSTMENYCLRHNIYFRSGMFVANALVNLFKYFQITTPWLSVMR